MTIALEKYNKIKGMTFYRKLGKVVNVVGLTIESNGPDARLADMCQIIPEDDSRPPIHAEVVGFKGQKTLLMPYEDTNGIGAGCMVVNLGHPLTVTVSDELLGKTLDGLGRPTELEEEIHGTEYSVEQAPPDPMDRVIISDVMPLGVKAVDGLMTIGKG